MLRLGVSVFEIVVGRITSTGLSSVSNATRSMERDETLGEGEGYRYLRRDG